MYLWREVKDMGEYSQADARKAIEILNQLKEEKEKNFEELRNKKNALVSQKESIENELNARNIIIDVIEWFGKEEIQKNSKIVNELKDKLSSVTKELYSVENEINNYNETSEGRGLLELNKMVESLRNQYKMQW